MSDSQDSNIQSGNRELTDFPKMVFGVMGSAGGDVPESAREKIYVIGAEVGRRGYTLVTGVAPGLPHDSVLGAKSEDGLVMGISPRRISPSMWNATPLSLIHISEPTRPY